MRSLPGAERWSRALLRMPGLSARWGSVCGWVMYPCGMMTISELRSRLQLLQRGGVPVPLSRSNPPQRVAASGDTGDLRITVSAFPSGSQPPRKPHSSCTPQPAELPEERGGPSQRCAPSVSFGAPLDDRMSIAASEGESDFAGDDASAQLPPSGTVAVPDTDPEMMAMLSRAANRVGTRVGILHRVLNPQGWTISTTGSFSLSLGNSFANTGIWCSVTSASWAFRSTGKRANSPQCRGSLFSVWSWIRSNSQHASQRNVLSRCWTAWIHSGAGQRSHWNFQWDRTDNTATVAYINHLGGLCSSRMSQLARHLLLWSQKHLRSLRAIHIPGVLNRVADELSRAALPEEWRLHPQVVQLIWGEYP